MFKVLADLYSAYRICDFKRKNLKIIAKLVLNTYVPKFYNVFSVGEYILILFSNLVISLISPRFMIA
jgi:hypothetical protein